MKSTYALTCCFTGHRNIPAGEKQKILTRVQHRLIPMIQFGVMYFGVGGALGFDEMIAEYLLELKKQNKRLKIIEVLPFDGYRAKWTSEQRERAERIDGGMDKIVYACKEPCRGAYLRRNYHLVDGSKYCLCYCNKTTGGTAMTVKYALEKGRTVYNASSFDVTSLIETK